ncbi:hypothetical protein HZS_4765 [Henneguya salminicola]|nr:hypothetical protein HZS_4765 [Henneguya salminicola]
MNHCDKFAELKMVREAGLWPVSTITGQIGEGRIVEVDETKLLNQKIVQRKKNRIIWMRFKKKC